MTLVDRYTRRTVRVTKEHGEDCRKLLKLMGIPYLEAPCEAEAQCAALAKAGKVWAVASEDMDTLCFGSPRLLRHLTFSEMKKVSIEEFHLEKVLKGLELSHEEFIDLCIMLGCDYTETIKGVGPKTAVNLIKQHRRIEDIIPNLPPKKVAPEDWNYDAVRKLFLEPEVMDPKDIVLKWSTPDEDGIVKFLCDENGFSRNNIKNAVAKLKKGMSSVTQGRLDGFFKAKPADAKAPVAANGGGKAKKTTASGTKRKSASGSATTTGSSTKKSKTKTKPK
ncbi:Elongation of fatty acids protein 2 [Spiromyces aspiralis]|uniref:Elongation of fatty acids protein 2 n=1 Tax=Spiromyces aspiralis TaxID=68401 RepID=A0ACC1HEX7_9FUNG|nr:Elongation of fatty acids protein 2 [Spiromyces aspiralis]